METSINSVRIGSLFWEITRLYSTHDYTRHHNGECSRCTQIYWANNCNHISPWLKNICGCLAQLTTIYEEFSIINVAYCCQVWFHLPGENLPTVNPHVTTPPVEFLKLSTGIDMHIVSPWNTCNDTHVFHECIFKMINRYTYRWPFLFPGDNVASHCSQGPLLLP